MLNLVSKYVSVTDFKFFGFSPLKLTLSNKKYF